MLKELFCYLWFVVDSSFCYLYCMIVFYRSYDELVFYDCMYEML